MRKAVSLILLLSTAFLAGCADTSEDSGTPVVPETQYQDEVVQIAVPVMPRDAPAPGERNLTSAPEWRLGEWWTYEMEDGFTGGTYSFTRIVAGEDVFAGNYLVGFPVDQFSNDVMLFHIPGFGDITQKDLSYETHDAYFQPLSFPLDQGAKWEVTFEGVATGLAEVTQVSGTTAHIEMNVSVYGSMVADYDAETGEITEMTIGPGGSYAHYKVTGHGYDYQGTVRVPHAHDLVFNHGRFAGAVNAGGFNQGPASTSLTDLVTVEEGYDRVSFIIAVGGGNIFLGAPSSVGVFKETVTAPDNTVYEAQWTPADKAAGRDLIIIAVGHDNPAGEWKLDHAAAGAGVAFVEGIGYHSIDIELPSGCVVASFNAQHHGGLCKVGSTSMTNSTAA